MIMDRRVGLPVTVTQSGRPQNRPSGSGRASGLARARRAAADSAELRLSVTDVRQKSYSSYLRVIRQPGGGGDAKLQVEPPGRGAAGARLAETEEAAGPRRGPGIRGDRD
jgi:hypothetical protein